MGLQWVILAFPGHTLLLLLVCQQKRLPVYALPYFRHFMQRLLADTRRERYFAFSCHTHFIEWIIGRIDVKPYNNLLYTPTYS